LNFIICILFYEIKEEGSETDSQCQSRRQNKPEPEEEEEEPDIGLWESVAWLSLLTLWISVLSEYLVNAIQVLPLLQFLWGEKGRKSQVNLSFSPIQS
jgi:Ca2+/H+ antiporter